MKLVTFSRTQSDSADILVDTLDRLAEELGRPPRADDPTAERDAPTASVHIARLDNLGSKSGNRGYAPSAWSSKSPS